MRTLYTLSILVCLLLFGAGCDKAPKSTVSPTPVPKTTPAPKSTGERPLQIALHDGEKAGHGDVESKLVEGTPLKPDRVQELSKLFSGPLPLPEKPPAFFKRSATLPLPRSVEVKEMATAPAAPPTPQANSKLEVMSVYPQGELARAPKLSISFSSPMIALSDPRNDETEAPLGIKLEPRPEGKWRWLGTQTLVFEPAGGEFPRATRYQVTIPEGIADVGGARLAKARTDSFTLSPAKVESFSPGGSDEGLDPLISVVFNQPMDAARTVPFISLKQEGSRVLLTQLTRAQVEEQDKEAAARFKDTADDRVFFFQPSSSLQRGTKYTIEVGKGARSVEGPLGTASVQTASFSTYGPLVLLRRSPKEGQIGLGFQGFMMTFNNELIQEESLENQVSVSPPVGDVRVEHSESQIYISGDFKGNTTYTVTVSSQLTDVFGQKLGKDLKLQFKTDKARRRLESGLGRLTVLQPGATRALPVFSTRAKRLNVRVSRVKPEDWADYFGFLDKNRKERESDGLPGTQLTPLEVPVKGSSDELVSTRIDLSQYLENGEGNLLVWIRDPESSDTDYDSRDIFTWVQATRLGIDVEAGAHKASVLVTDLSNGKPISDARVAMGSATGKTDASGVSLLALPDTRSPLLLVTRGASQAFLPYRDSWWDRKSGWKRESLTTDFEWLLFDDRGLYKPGERAHIKGYVRGWERGPRGQLSVPKAGTPISWVLRDPRSNKVKEGTTRLDSFGGLDLEVAIPSKIDLGSCELTLNGSGLPVGRHTLQVEEFRRPEFECTTRVASEEPQLLLGSATVECQAQYYAGGGLAGTEVDWEVTTRPSSFTPPGQQEYSFGKWSPWWNMGCWWDYSSSSNDARYTYQGKTDGSGTHQLGMDFLEMSPPQPTEVEVAATVVDLNRQRQESSTHLLVHPSERYVGLKAEKSFVEEGADFEMEAIVADIEGRVLPGIPIELELLKVDYGTRTWGAYEQKEVPVETKALTSQAGPARVVFSPRDGGTYRVRATVVDQKGRLNQSEYTFWKSGAKLPSSDRVEIEDLTAVPDKKEYKPGDTARILVMAPFAEGEGVAVWNRDGLLSEERFDLKDGSAVLQQPITEEHVPNLRASITVVGKADWRGWERPALATSMLNLSVSTDSRKLTVEIRPDRQTLDPGAQVDIPVQVRDHQGHPVPGAEVTLWVVDEAVLGLTGYLTPELLSAFYRERPDLLEAGHNREYVVLGEQSEVRSDRTDNDANRYGRGLSSVGVGYSGGGRVENLTGPGYLNYDSLVGTVGYPQYHGVNGLLDRDKYGAPFNSGYGFDTDGDAIRRLTLQKLRKTDDIDVGAEFSAYIDKDSHRKFAVRKDFSAQAVFKAALKTDASGITRVHTKLPDNLTRYRIMAVAVKDADKFGNGEAPLTARLPLMVKPSLPRFLNFGDRARLPVVLHNQTDSDLIVDVIAESAGLTLLGPTGKSVKVPAQDRVEVQFEARSESVGQASVRFGAVSSKYSDAATMSLPVYTPCDGESFATYGQVGDAGAVKQMVRKPDEVWPQFGGLEITLSSTALSELTDAFLYLYQYPYECSEQKASRMLAVAAMSDVLAAFNPREMPSAVAIKMRMQADIEHLQRVQNFDDGWPYWNRGSKTSPFVTLHVMHALARAKAQGYAVDSSTLEHGLNYLQKIDAKCRLLKYSEDSIRSLTAYALYVRNLLHDPDVAAAQALFAQLQKEPSLDLEALGWIWPTLYEHAKNGPESQEIKRLVLNQASQTADKAHFTTGMSQQQGYLILHSSHRVDALLLSGLLQADPKNPLNTKLVRGLLAGRSKGRWNNTQENIWVLLALQSYFRTYEKETPNFLAGLWLDQAGLGQETFSGRSAKEAGLTIPMEELKDGEHGLTVSKKGPGRLYYRVGLKYAPKALRLPADSRGFTVERSYKGLDSADDVKQMDNGDWRIKAGARVEVTLTMVCPERRYHVALVDQLPAGLEPLNPVLKGTPGNQDATDRWWSWYQHDNLRDERVEAFATELGAGVYTYTYSALATTPGEYILPSLHAEEMYSPEVFGRTASGRMTIE